MTPDSRSRVRDLALWVDDEGAAVVLDVPVSAVRRHGVLGPIVGAVLDRIDSMPALVINRIGDVLAHTAGAGRVFGPIGMLDGSPGNLSRYVYTDPRAREAFPDWEEVADRVAIQLRLEVGPETEPLVQELTRTAGSVFTDRMSGPVVVPNRYDEVRVNHPTAGRLRLAYETLDLGIVEELHLLIYLPADEITTRQLDRLSAGHDR